MVEVATVEKQQALELKPIGGSEVQRVEEVVEGEGEEEGLWLADKQQPERYHELF